VSPRRLVLTYHRVARPQHDPWETAVAPEHFDEQLSVLRKHCAVMTLGRMLDQWRAGTLARNAVAVTFDDGYADNLHTAIPILERHEVPATFLLCPGLLDGKGPFWWDELGRILLGGDPLPKRLELGIEATTVLWERPDRETPWRASARPWRGWDPATEPGQELYLNLWKTLKPLRREAQERVLSELRAWAGTREPRAADDRPLALDEAAELSSHPLAGIGAHTLTHPTLPAQDGKAKLAEIAGGKRACEDIAGRAVGTFSYPYGDRDMETASLVREAGFEVAFTTQRGPIRPGDQAHDLPRVQVHDWDGAEFERMLLTGGLW
jgi:peptidoglycan/xylan/chitin deacetylase (PgdA/CDA1 family)